MCAVRFTAQGSSRGHFISFCYSLSTAQKRSAHNPLWNNSLILISCHSNGYAFSAPRETWGDTFCRRMAVSSHSSPTLAYLVGCTGSVCCLYHLEGTRQSLLKAARPLVIYGAFYPSTVGGGSHMDRIPSVPYAGPLINDLSYYRPSWKEKKPKQNKKVLLQSVKLPFTKQDHYLNPSDKPVDGEHSGEEKPEGHQVSKIPRFLKETLVGVS